MPLDFTGAMDRIKPLEGGYTAGLPGDPGGETNFGISKRSYPNLDIKSLTWASVVPIYKRDFWDAIQGDLLSPAVAYQLLDFAINSGPETALRQYQAVLGVAPDGHFGPASIQASKAMAMDRQLILVIASRLAYMVTLRNWPQSGAGWANRIVADLRYAANDLLT